MGCKLSNVIYMRNDNCINHCVAKCTSLCFEKYIGQKISLEELLKNKFKTNTSTVSCFKAKHYEKLLHNNMVTSRQVTSIKDLSFQLDMNYHDMMKSVNDLLEKNDFVSVDSIQGLTRYQAEQLIFEFEKTYHLKKILS